MRKHLRNALIAVFVGFALVAPSCALGSPTIKGPTLRPTLTHPLLNLVASIFAQRTATVECPSPEAWAKDPFAKGTAGYTWLGENTAYIDPKLCDAALDLNNTTISQADRAFAVLVIVHESYHIRIWDLAGNEAAVECRAIRHWAVGAALLGASPETIVALRPFAIAEHWSIAARYPQYYTRNCHVPPLR